MWRGLLISAVALAGCADDDPGHLRAQGAVVVVLEDGTETGFELPDDVRLDDDRVAPEDGRLAGHCTIGRGAEGEHDVLSVGLGRTAVGDEAGMGLRALEIRMDDPVSGEVHAEVGTSAFSAESGASCTLSRPYVEPQDGLAAVIADCVLTGPDAQTAQVMVDLQLAGCRVE